MNCDDQFEIARTLRGIYLDDGAYQWLISPQPLLNGAIPAQMMAAGNSEQVLAVVNGIATKSAPQFQ